MDERNTKLEFEPLGSKFNYVLSKWILLNFYFCATRFIFSLAVVISPKWINSTILLSDWSQINNNVIFIQVTKYECAHYIYPSFIRRLKITIESTRIINPNFVQNFFFIIYTPSVPQKISHSWDGTGF